MVNVKRSDLSCAAQSQVPSDGHGKCNTRDEAGAAQGGTNEVWRGQGPFTSVLNMPRGCWTSADQLAK